MELFSHRLGRGQVPTQRMQHVAAGNIVQPGKVVKNLMLLLSLTGLLSFAHVGHADETFQQCLDNAKTSHERSECYWARSRQQRGR